MSSPLKRFNQIPRQLRDRMRSDFVASFIVVFGAGVAFFAIMALLIVLVP